MGHGIWTFAVSAAVCVGALALLGGFLGWFHASGDSLAVFRVHIALGTIALSAAALWAGAHWIGTAGLGVALLALGTVAPHWVAGTGRAAAAETGVAVYQKNLWFRLDDPAAIAADILASGADIVTLQEVGPRTEQVLETLQEAYPVQIVCPSSRVGGVAVLSRLPEHPDSRVCYEGKGLVSIGLETSQGPIRAASVHLHWPWPHQQSRQVADLTMILRDWDTPAVIGGDFNMVRWSYTLREIGRASGTSPVGPSRVTLRNKRLFLNASIDHVLATGGQGTNSLRPTAGSDHNGLLAGTVVGH